MPYRLHPRHVAPVHAASFLWPVQPPSPIPILVVSLSLPDSHDPVIVHCAVHRHRCVSDVAAVVVYPAGELLVLVTFHNIDGRGMPLGSVIRVPPLLQPPAPPMSAPLLCRVAYCNNVYV